MDYTLGLELYFIIVVFSFQLKLVNCYSAGAPAESCDTLSLNSSYHGALEQTSSVTVPFEIDTSVFKNPFSDVLHYSPNSTYWSKLNSPV